MIAFLAEVVKGYKFIDTFIYGIIGYAFFI